MPSKRKNKQITHWINKDCKLLKIFKLQRLVVKLNISDEISRLPLCRITSCLISQIPINQMIKERRKWGTSKRGKARIGHLRLVVFCLSQSEASCIFYVKMSSICMKINMQVKLIFIRMVSHQDSLWYWSGKRWLRNGLFPCSYPALTGQFFHSRSQPSLDALFAWSNSVSVINKSKSSLLFQFLSLTMPNKCDVFSLAIRDKMWGMGYENGISIMSLAWD